MKKGIFYFLFTALIVLGERANAQTAYRNQELLIRNDNDVYTFRDSDKYYSNGFIFKYRWVAEPGKWLSPKQLPDSSKVIIETELSQRFWTPQFLELTNFEDYDRPYAGLLTGGYYVNVFPKSFKRYRYGMDLTLVGQSSGAGAFQEWYHEIAGFPEPMGWIYQIPNELTVNFHGNFQRQFMLVDEHIDMVLETSATLGTAFINAMQRVDFRFGNLEPLSFSSFANSMIGNGSRNTKVQGYLFAGLGVEYVAYNITIQGSMFDDEAPHTENIVPWVRHMRFGTAFSSDKSTFMLTYNWLGTEVKDVRWHSYISLELQLRFIPKGTRKKGYNK